MSKWKHLWNTLLLESPVFTHQAMGFASPPRHAFYEFSCSSSSSSRPVRSSNRFYATRQKSRSRFFMCADERDVEEMEIESIVVLSKMEELAYAKRELEVELDKCGYPLTPFSVRVSNYSWEEEGEGRGVGFEIDDMAEDFIEKFYEGLRAQKLEA